MSSLLIRALSCKEVERPPVWLMRQAGRYLPEYQALRKKHSLDTLFHDPELAKEVTFMPLKRFPLDAAIVFSDILILAEVWDKKVLYVDGQAPRIIPFVSSAKELWIPTSQEILEKLSYVFQTITLLKKELTLPLIGFSGAPFTLLCYLLEGSGKSSFPKIREWISERKEEFLSLLEIVSETVILFAKEQIKLGIDAFQVFDSWANLLSPEEFEQFALPYWKKIKEALSVPVLFFSRANSQYVDLIEKIKPTAISFDEGLSLETLRKRLPDHIAVQGNFSPHLLETATPDQIREAAFSLKESVKGKRGIIFNLGHGVLPKTPLENVTAFLEGLSRES